MVMMSEQISGSNCDGESSHDSSGDEEEEFHEGSCPIGSAVMVKYKSRAQVSGERGTIPLTATPPTPTSLGVCCLQEDTDTPHRQRQEICSSFLFKEPPLPSFHKNHPHKRPCIWCGIFLIIVLLGSIGLGALIWKRATSSWTSARASSISNFTVDDGAPTTDSPCHTALPSGYLSDLFFSGYDPSRVNLLLGNAHNTSVQHEKRKSFRPVLMEETSLLRICRLTQRGRDDDGDKKVEDGGGCNHPQSRSRVIESFADFQKWNREHITMEQDSSSSTVMGFHGLDDPELLSIQADLMTGHRVVMTQLSCPVLDVSLSPTPSLAPKFVQQLKLVQDQETALETMEDFGTAYVDRAVLGRSIIIRFTLNKTAVDWLKARKNQSLAMQATTAGLFLLSLSNASAVHLPAKSQEIAVDFMAAARGGGRLYADSMMDLVEANRAASQPYKWIRTAFQKQSSILGLRLKPLVHLFDDTLLNDSKLMEFWRGGTRQAHKFVDDEAASITLPLLYISTNESAILQTGNSQNCLELCRADRLCSVAIFCASTSCPKLFGSRFDCALHRQQEFNQGVVTTLPVSTHLPIRHDLKPVTLRGFAIHGLSLYSTNQLADLASCTRLCTRTSNCSIVSFSGYGKEHKVCRLYQNMTGNELRQHEHSTVMFIMSSFGPCFPDESKLKRGICPANADCWNGLCVCRQYYYKNETSCASIISSSQRVNKHRKQSSYNNNSSTLKHETSDNATIRSLADSWPSTLATTPKSSTKSSMDSVGTTATPSHSQVTNTGYSIRGIYTSNGIAPTTPADLTNFRASVGWKEQTRMSTKLPASVYTPRPWQMRPRNMPNNNGRIVLTDNKTAAIADYHQN